MDSFETITTVPAEYKSEYLSQGEHIANALLEYNKSSSLLFSDPSPVLRALDEYWNWLEFDSDLKDFFVLIRRHRTPLSSHTSHAPGGTSPALNFKVPQEIVDKWGHHWALVAATVYMQGARNSVLLGSKFSKVLSPDGAGFLARQRGWCQQFLSPDLLTEILRGNMPMKYPENRPVESPFYPNAFLRFFKLEPVISPRNQPVQIPAIIFLCRAVQKGNEAEFWCVPDYQLLEEGDIFLMLDNLFQRRPTYLEMNIFLGMSSQYYTTVFKMFWNPNAPIPANFVAQLDIHRRLVAVPLDEEQYDLRGPEDAHDAKSVDGNSQGGEEPVFYDAMDVDEENDLGAEDVFKYNKSCSICFQSFRDGHLLCHLECGHTLHAYCLSRWFHSHDDRSCAVCRESVPVHPQCEK